MERLIEKFNQLLTTKLPGSQFFPESTRTRIGGTILWDGFSGMDQIDRQSVVRRLIRENFDMDEQSRISLILTFTPHEYAIIKEESA